MHDSSPEVYLASPRISLFFVYLYEKDKVTAVQKPTFPQVMCHPRHTHMQKVITV